MRRGAFADDPWLSTRMTEYAYVRRAEATLQPAVQQAVADYLATARQAVTAALSTAPLAFTADPAPDGEGDPAGLPPASAWQHSIDRFILGPARGLWRGSFGRVTGRAPDTDTTYTSGLHDRLSGFRRQVADRLRRALGAGQQAGETPAQLRARVAALMTLENWDGQVMTMTRTETLCALNSGAFHGALTEQERTGQPWQKSWLSTDDRRVRDTHHDADSQVRGLHDPFTVGGAALQFPGDPLGPPGETVNCRCACRYGPAGDASLTAAPTPQEQAIATRVTADFHGTVGRPSYRLYHPSGRNRGKGKKRHAKGGWMGSPRFTETEHEDAMLDYTARAYRDMNSWLRERKAPVRATEEQNRRAIYALNDLISIQDPTESEMTLWRGTRQIDLGLQPGDVFHDRGFGSTSSEDDLPRAFTGVGGSLFQIRAPAGTQMLNVAGVGGDHSEREFILPPGTQYRVTAVHDSGNPLETTVYELEIING